MLNGKNPDAMKPVFLLLAATFLFSQSTESQSVLDYVDLFICTAGDHGQLDPSATVPFGMVKLGPDTEPGNHSGYDYHARKVKGFSHSRVPGVGCRGAGGSFLLKPGIGYPDDAAEPIDKKREEARPGYYRVYMPKAGINCELTANNYVGYHRYTFPKAGLAYIMIDPENTYVNLIGAGLEVQSEKEITGWVSAGTVCNKGAFTQYFYGLFSKRPIGFQSVGKKTYALFQTTPGEQITVKIAISPISSEQAKIDLENSVGTKSFEAVRKEAEQAWQQLLSSVIVEGKRKDKVLFYTHLYHSCLLPVNVTSTTGIYKGIDGQIYEAKGYTYYNGWSIWDTYRTKLPLLTLLFPNKMEDFARSIASLYLQGEGLTGWSGPHEPVPTVRKEHSLIVLLDAYQKGIPGIDFEQLWPEILAEVPTLPYTTPDNILETSYDYWAIAEVAGILGKTGEEQQYRAWAKNYQHIWKMKFMKIEEQSDVMHKDGLYEGTLWQYRWSVPWDIEGIITLVGGKDTFTTQLEQFFDDNLYNHGNQPDIQVPFMFNYSNKPWRTQEMTHRILYSGYGTGLWHP